MMPHNFKVETEKIRLQFTYAKHQSRNCARELSGHAEGWMEKLLTFVFVPRNTTKVGIH